MVGNRNKPPFQWILIVLFITITVITIAIGSVYLSNLRKTILNSKKDELSGFANLKVNQIVRWWHERLGDAIIIKSNSALIDEVNNFLTKENNDKEKAAIKKLFEAYLSTFDYNGVQIIDSKGNIRFVLPEGRTIENVYFHSLIPEVSETKNVMLTDIHQSGNNKLSQIDLIIPLQDKINSTDTGRSVIILTIDPKKILYPLLKSWPSSSKTSESLLIRKERDSVVYLSPLKHRDNDSVFLKLPVSDTNLIAVKAVNGFIGLTTGIDYSGVPVLAATKKIPGSGWYMVAKVDLSEVNSEIRGQVATVVMLIILFISAFGSVTGWTIWHQRVRFYRQKYESEQQQLALRKHFDYLLKYANDIVLLMDKDLCLLEVNDRALEIYQYTREELIGMNIRILRLPEYHQQLDEKIDILRKSGSATYETYHRRKDGSTFPVEISARLFEIEGKEYYQSIGRDITERSKIEANLNQILERYNIATRAGKLAVWDWDIVNDILIWDDKVYELFGIAKGEVSPVFDSWLKIVHPDDRDTASQKIRDAISGKNEYDTEFRVVHPDGFVRYIKAYGQVVRKKDGSPLRLIGINYDITEQKSSELLLREREFWLTESQKVGKVGSYNFDIKSLTWTSSEVLDEIFGIDKDFERTLGGWNMLIHPDFKEEMLDYVRTNVILNKGIFDREYMIINHKTGKEIWVYGRGELRLDSNGDVERLIGTIQDITDRKKTDQKLHVTEQTYRDLFETVSDAIYIHKPDGIFMDVNMGALTMYGYSKDELIGKSPLYVGAPGRNDMNKLTEILNRVFETGISEQFEFWGMRKNGEIFPKEVVSNKGKYFGQDVIISTARDITLRKNYEDQLRNAKEKAEESDRLKTAFLHNISHEIRTPMNAIVGFTALLEEPDLDVQSRKHFINIISQSTSQLLGIISDIVDISNIETGQVKLNFTEVNLNSMIKSIYDQYRITAEEKRLLMFYDASLPDDRVNIYSDKTKLIQILSNLINNALKFTNQGSIQFGYRLQESYIEFYVKDTGIGIPEDKINKVFDRFYQIESDSSRRYSGAGLGLSISKAYVELLGGKIWLKSTPGIGSEFCFTHPF